MAKGSGSKKCPYIDLPNVPDVFVDGIAVAVWDGRFAKLTFSVNRFEPAAASAEPRETRYTAARIVLSPKALAELHGRLTDIMEKLQRTGVFTKKPAATLQ